MTDFRRISGLVTGFDTEKMVKDMMRIERMKVDRVEQKKTALEWKRSAYREVSSMLRGFSSEYFDVLKPETNMTSSATYDVFKATTLLNGSSTDKVTINPAAGSSQGDITINAITQLASKDTWTSNSHVQSLKSSGLDITKLNGVIADGKKLSIKIDGVIKEVTLTGGADKKFTDVNEVVSELQASINTSFGTGKVTVSNDGGQLSFNAPGHSVQLKSSDSIFIGVLGFKDGASNTIDKSDTLANQFGITDEDLSFKINGVSVSGLSANMTVESFMNKVNASNAGVNITYSSLNNTFTMTSKKEGVANNINLEDTKSFFANKLKIDGSNRTQGQDAIFTINGVTTSRSSNTFDVDGVGITLNQTHNAADGDIKVGIKVQTEQVVDKIVKFVDKYNKMVEFLNKKLNEEKYRDFKPLTDEQKKSLKEDDIKNWEKKAKSGLLRRDGTVEKILSDLRNAITQAVEGSGLTLDQVGISTTANYKDGGKLVVDKTKLENAIKSNPNDVIKLFSKVSDTAYTDSANRSKRFNENGFIHRIKDIIDDNIRITRDSSGEKGALIEKAGYELDSTDTKSFISEQIKQAEDRISTMLKILNSKQQAQYQKFARLEKAMARLQQQSSSLIAQLGGGK